MKRIAFGSTAAPPMPSKIVAVGRNYREHAKELGNVAPEEEPLLFLKAPTSLVLGGGDIVMPQESSRVDYEGELALVIGRRIKDWPQERWLDALAGVCCANDVTARDLQEKDGQWARAKSFDTFCPVGPEIVTDLDPSDLGIETRVNGTVKQASRTSEMVFSPAFLVSYISRMMTLLPGDLILTGTPAGIAPLSAGDLVEVEIEKIGVLQNRVAGASARD
ncbi:MAG TPA: fumarylacetoacetate hydrolase family protein [Thermoanaerobaculia bacterium]|nr:fumarylacetoacetate hydrolase family protein [Thermoanaerobaculia bacterium]